MPEAMVAAGMAGMAGAGVAAEFPRRCSDRFAASAALLSFEPADR